ncbi:N-acetylglucosamine kinase [Saccharococcus caldoxylosilyticus]|uniref:N-acetylglucosamine kinase n=2 Tax=Saccharococcus caldoxylosilyticus TaxID=81408 RepID=UPI0003189EEF|nr:BadF/BadG/BcrA/BcrD ATPase family protein [Parageobacillus caldoxylosilyticus]
MNKQVYPLLAVDGGGTKTIAVIANYKGEILGKGNGGASNYQVVGRDIALQSIQMAVQEALKSINQSLLSYPLHFKKAIFALAGIDTKKDEIIVNDIVQEAISSLSIEVNHMVIENDCLAALLGVTPKTPGALLISGTGSIVYAHNGKGKIVRVGGWGHRVGDEGSGYWIGKEAIRSVLKMYDGREKNTILAQLLLQHFQFNSLEDLYNWVYSEHYSVDDVAALTMVVEQGLNQGDEVSQKILDQASYELEKLLLVAISHVIEETDNNFSLILQGGVLQNNSYIRNKILKSLKRRYPNFNLLSTHREPIYNIIQRGLQDEGCWEF